MFGSDRITSGKRLIALIGLKTKADKETEGEGIRGGVEDSSRYLRKALRFCGELIILDLL